MFSLVLNGALALWLTWPSGQASTERERISLASPQPRPPAAQLEGPARTDAGWSGTDAGVPFHWSQVESDDYRQYLANLRAIGCPEPIVRDIIVADLHQQYAGRLQALWPAPAKREFWQKPDYSSRHPSSMILDKVLDEQERKALQELLGIRGSKEELCDALFLHADRYSVELAFLPPAKRARAERAFSEAALRDSDMDEPGYEYPSGLLETRLLAKRLAVLTPILSSEELNEYRLRLAPEAQQVRADLRHFACSPEEFAGLVKIKGELAMELPWPEQYDERQRRESEAARKLLGEQRGEEYAKNRDGTWICASEAALRYGLAPDVPERVWALKQAVEASAQRLGADPSLSSAERRARLTALQSEAKAGFTRILGERGARFARRYDPWLQCFSFMQPRLNGY